MAYIKQIHVNDATYDFKDEVARNGLDVLAQEIQGKQDTITAVVNPTVVENGGQPSASVTFQNGELGFAFSNLKGEQGIQGQQGIQGDSFQPIEDVSGLVLAHVPGQDNTKAMSQKGVGDYYPEVRSSIKMCDFEIADKDGHVLFRLKGGHLRTKYFDSEIAPISSSDGFCDFSVSDRNGNKILACKNGHIISKFFSSHVVLSQIVSLQSETTKLKESKNPFGFAADRIYKDSLRRSKFSNAIPLVIIAGQSNADGRVPYTSAPEWLSDNDYSLENFSMWTGTDFAEYNVRTNNGASVSSGGDGTGVDKFGFDVFFAKEFVEKYGELYAIKQAIGGVGFEDYTNRSNVNYTWCPFIGRIEEEYGVEVTYCVLSLIEKYNRALAWAEANNKTLLPVAILWHQGEHEASSQFIPKYKNNLECALSFLRGVFGMPEIPIISGDIIKDYNSYAPSVNEILHDVGDEDSHMRVVSMEGHYTSLGDDLHYDAAACEYLGGKMFDYYEEIH